MTGVEFEARFIAQCTEMRITTTLASSAYLSAAVWAVDDTHRIRAVNYCGCADARIVRNGRDVYSVCNSHHVQPLGLAVRIRVNHVYAEAMR